MTPAEIKAKQDADNAATAARVAAEQEKPKTRGAAYDEEAKAKAKSTAAPKPVVPGKQMHHGRIKGSTASAADQAKAAGFVAPSRLPTKENPLQTPGLAGLKPLSESSVDRNGNAVATKGNPNAAIAARAQMSRASGGDGATIGVVTDDGWRDKARNIADIGKAKAMADPPARADSLAGQPGVKSIALRDPKSGKLFVGGAGAEKSATPASMAASMAQASPVAPQFKHPTPGGQVAPASSTPAVGAVGAVGGIKPIVAGVISPKPAPVVAGVPVNPTDPRSQLDQNEAAASMERIAEAGIASANPAKAASDAMAGSNAGTVNAANAANAANQTPFSNNALFQPVTLPKSPGAIAGVTPRMAGMGPANARIPAGPNMSLVQGSVRAGQKPPRQVASTLPSGRPVSEPIRVAAGTPATLPAGPVNPTPQPRQVIQTAQPPTTNKLLAAK